MTKMKRDVKSSRLKQLLGYTGQDQASLAARLEAPSGKDPSDLLCVTWFVVIFVNFVNTKSFHNIGRIYELKIKLDFTLFISAYIALCSYSQTNQIISPVTAN